MSRIISFRYVGFLWSEPAARLPFSTAKFLCFITSFINKAFADSSPSTNTVFIIIFPIQSQPNSSVHWYERALLWPWVAKVQHLVFHHSWLALTRSAAFWLALFSFYKFYSIAWVPVSHFSAFYSGVEERMCLLYECFLCQAVFLW